MTQYIKKFNKTQKSPIKPIKPNKTHVGCFFFNKTRVFANPDSFESVTSQAHICVGVPAEHGYGAPIKVPRRSGICQRQFPFWQQPHHCINYMHI